MADQKEHDMAVAAVKTQPEPDPLGLDSMTAGETAMAEKQAGQSIITLGNENFPQTALMGSLGWVLARRGDPKLTYVAYMASRKLADITAELFPGSDDDEEADEEKGDGSPISAS